MSRMTRVRMQNRSGAVVVIVALMLVVIVGMAAFAVDTGVLFSARSDAQRAADAAALAAVSAFLEPPVDREAIAVARGKDFAARNDIIHSPISEDEVTIDILTTTSTALRVRATVRREAVQMFFAGIWGKPTLPVSAAAEAEARPAGVVDCLKPFAIPDETYSPDDYGMLVKIWQVGDPDLVLVGFNDNEPPGLGNIAPHIANECIDGNSAALGDQLLWEKPGQEGPGGGDGVGQVMKGMKVLLGSDDLTWSELDGGFNREDWASSPRVGNVVLYNRQVYQAGTGQVEVLNFAKVYFSHSTGQAGNPNNPYTVWGRIFPADGLGTDCETGPGCAENAFTIRLVN